MSFQIIALHNEISIMRELKSSTISLIHHTDDITPIKRLAEAHDIIDLNLQVQEKFKDFKDSPIWDIPALKDLNRIRCELIAFHNNSFQPATKLLIYNKELMKFFRLMQIRTQKQIF